MALPTLEALRTGGKRVLARTLSAVETAAGTAELAMLLDEACAAPRGVVLGLTGPPGVGKSTLTSALLGRARARGETVGVIAVDPSSRRTGGALLGDRARIATDPQDSGVFIRSFAARDRLGGLSDEAVAAMVLMRAIYDLVIVESVGIGQSEADISLVADTVLLCVQPGSGDSLQFMKAGITELPDVIAVTKADIGEAARRTRADVAGALSLDAEGRARPVLAISVTRADGLDALEEALRAHRAWLLEGDRIAGRRRAQEEAWVAQSIRARFGTVGLAAARDLARGQGGPFTVERELAHELLCRLGLAGSA